MSLFSHSIGAKDNFCRDADRIAGLSLKSNKDDAVFTTKISTPIIHTSQIMSQSSHLKIGSKDTNDFNIFLNNAETLQLTRSGTEVRYQSNGGTGKHRFMNDVEFNGDINLASGKEVKINGTNILSTIQSDITTLQNTDTSIMSSLNAKVDTSALGDYATLVNLEDTDNDLQGSINLKSNIASPSFTGTGTFTKSDNYGQIELTDSKPIAAGVGGGITMNGVYGGSGQTTGLAHIKAKKSNSTTGDYHGDLSLSVRENGEGDYTEVIKLKGEDLKTILNGGLKVVGSVINISNIPTASSGLSTGDIWSNSGVLTIV